jgi:FAD/FMN-containing dehydrogenase
MRIAPQGTGHGSEPLEPLQDAMLLRTVRMRGVRIDPAARIARTEAGALWQDVTVPAGQHGLAALAGSSPNVGVTGYTLGGGMGWLARRYGLAANSVTAADIVTPDGRLRRADADHDPDLLWAVKGGGGSVGVVTALEMRLYPVRARRTYVTVRGGMVDGGPADGLAGPCPRSPAVAAVVIEFRAGSSDAGAHASRAAAYSLGHGLVRVLSLASTAGVGYRPLRSAGISRVPAAAGPWLARCGRRSQRSGPGRPARIGMQPHARVRSTGSAS